MKKIVLVVASIVFLVVGLANAGTLQLNGPTGISVSIHDPGVGGATAAAMYNATFDSQSYQVFCTDYATINWNTPYSNYSMIALPGSAAYKEAAYIYGTYGSINGPVAQLAVWEVVFEGLSGGTALTVRPRVNFNDMFYVTALGGFTEENLTLADSYVAEALANSGNFNTSDYRLLVSPTTQGFYGAAMQDFITRVPEPATMLLFGLGLLGLAGLRRKLKK